MKINKTTEESILSMKRLQPGISVRALAKMHDVHHTVVTRVLAGGGSVQETSDMKGDKWELATEAKTPIRNLAELVAHCKIDLLEWKVDRWTCNRWEGFSKDAAGDITVTPLYQVKAFLTRRTTVIDARKELEDLKALAKKDAPEPRKVVKPSGKSNLMLELSLSDAHFGKLAHSDETRASNQDTKIMEKTYRRAFDTLLGRVSSYTFSEIAYVIGNDILQSDDAEGRTTAGTYVSTDGRYYKTFRTVRSLLIENIEYLRTLCQKVHVIVVPGNHDSRGCFFLGDSIECYFAKYKDVVVNNEPTPRKYHRFHDVLLGFTHGHEGKHSDYPIMMATEVPSEFGATKFREMHCGHKHKRSVDLTRMKEGDESHGVRVRILPALTATDSWHAKNGFINNLRSSEAFVWDGKEGLIGTAVYTEPN